VGADRPGDLERRQVDHRQQLLLGADLLARDDVAAADDPRDRRDQRDLQLLKVPLFRGIDVAVRTLDILPPAIEAMRFRPENINLDPAIHAAEEANAMVVREGIPFREAYRRVGARFKSDG
jgi:hypothetical protein